MKSKLLGGGLCLAVALLFALPVSGQEVITGKIARDATKVYSITTDTSAIIDVLVTTNTATDIDILAFRTSGAEERLATNDEDDEDAEELAADDVLLRAEAGVLQLEKGVISVPGATTVTICVTNVAGPLARITILFSTPAGSGIAEGAPALRVREVGEFRLDERVYDARLAELQGFVREQVDAKRR